MDNDIFSGIGAARPKGGGELLPALMTAGVNAAGGLVAGRVDVMVSGAFGLPWAGTLVVFGLTVGMRMYFDGTSDGHAAARELAGGMAGWVGDDLFYFVRDWLLTKEWKAGRSYRTGDRVRYAGRVYEATKEIAATPVVEPSNRSSGWAEPAQGFRNADEIRQAAQALTSDDRTWQSISDQVFRTVGPEFERISGTELNEDQVRAIRGTMRETLASVVQQSF